MKQKARDSRPAVSPARAAAFDILLRVERESSYASELLHSRTYARLTAVDHSLATELVMGVLRWRSLLDSQIAANSAQPLSKLDLEVLTALRLAIYQLRWLSRIPARAAINESVELVKRARKRSAAPVRQCSPAEARHERLPRVTIPAIRNQRCFVESSRWQQRPPVVARRTLGPVLRTRFRLSYLSTRSIGPCDRNPPAPSGSRRANQSRRNRTRSRVIVGFRT